MVRTNLAKVGEEVSYATYKIPSLNSDANKLFANCNELLEMAWTTRQHGNMDFCRQQLTLLHKKLGELYDCIEQQKVYRTHQEPKMLPIQPREW